MLEKHADAAPGKRGGFPAKVRQEQSTECAQTNVPLKRRRGKEGHMEMLVMHWTHCFCYLVQTCSELQGRHEYFHSADEQTKLSSIQRLSQPVSSRAGSVKSPQSSACTAAFTETLGNPNSLVPRSAAGAAATRKLRKASFGRCYVPAPGTQRLPSVAFPS